jgi:ABC-2 type transport system ATP-binding protein
MTDPSADDALAIEARGLERAYGDRLAVAGIDLAVARGECLGLLGPNGAGKTTTIKVLSTVIRASAGTVRVLGLDAATRGAAIRARIGVVPQELALYDALSARENLAFFGELFGLPAARLAERVAWGLAIAGLEARAHSRVGEFSGGMKRRLNIVASLLHEPELVFLDEPTVGIDPQSRNHIFELIERELLGRVTLVYTTHQLGEVERLCDRIVVMDDGRAIAAGSLAELQADHRAARGGARSLEFDDGVELDEVARVLSERGIGCRVRERGAGLEQVFLQLTGKALRDDD